MARFTKGRLAKRDDPIYREGLTIFTPYTARSPRAPNPPAEKSQGDADTYGHLFPDPKEDLAKLEAAERSLVG